MHRSHWHKLRIQNWLPTLPRTGGCEYVVPVAGVWLQAGWLQAQGTGSVPRWYCEHTMVVLSLRGLLPRRLLLAGPFGFATTFVKYKLGVAVWLYTTFQCKVERRLKCHAVVEVCSHRGVVSVAAVLSVNKQRQAFH